MHGPNPLFYKKLYGIHILIILAGSSVAQESVYQLQKKERESDNDSAIGTSLWTISGRQATASNVSQTQKWPIAVDVCVLVNTVQYRILS